MQALLFNSFSNFNVKVQDDVIQYLLKNLSREYKAVDFITSKINHAALTYKKKITIPFVKKIMEER
jgi:chromosomal replication initiation ATPase DnaA